MTLSRDNDAYSVKQNPVDYDTEHGKDMDDMTTVAAIAQTKDRIEAQSTITSRGQITFPAKIMKKLGLKEGDLLRFIYEGGELHVEPISLLSEEDLFGSLDRPEDQGNFVLDLEAARSEHSLNILSMKHPKNFGGD